MGKENFEDFIKDHGAEFEEIEGNAEEESVKEEELIKDEAREGIEEFEKRMKFEGPATRVNNFRAYLRLVVKELKKDPDALENSPYLKTIYDGIEKRAYNDKDPNIRQEAQDVLDKCQELIN